MRLLLRARNRTWFAIVAATASLFGCEKSNEAEKPQEKPIPNEIAKADMLDPNVVKEIAEYVRSGFYDKERITEVFSEELYEPGEIDSAGLEVTIDNEFAKWNAEKAAWPKITDCDRLDTAFLAISKRGIIALQNAGNTQSIGYEEFLHVYSAAKDRASIAGYCFYHHQDLERAVRGKGLYLAFGPANASDEDARGAEIGRIIREELERAGLKVEWDGTFASRMRITPLTWQKR